MNNCCINNQTNAIARNTSNSCKSIVDQMESLRVLAADAFDGIESAVASEDIVDDPVILHDYVCAGECCNVSVSCCKDDTTGTCCSTSKPNATVCLAAEAYAYVILRTTAGNYFLITYYWLLLMFAFMLFILNSYTINCYCSRLFIIICIRICPSCNVCICCSFCCYKCINTYNY